MMTTILRPWKLIVIATAFATLTSVSMTSTVDSDDPVDLVGLLIGLDFDYTVCCCVLGTPEGRHVVDGAVQSLMTLTEHGEDQWAVYVSFDGSEQNYVYVGSGIRDEYDRIVVTGEKNSDNFLTLEDRAEGGYDWIAWEGDEAIGEGTAESKPSFRSGCALHVRR